MKNSLGSIWRKLAWPLLVIFAVLTLISTWFAYDTSKRFRIQLNQAKATLVNSQNTIGEFEKAKAEFNSLREQNSSLEEDVKALNRIAQSLDQFVIIDPDQILSDSSQSGIEPNWKYSGYVPVGTHVFDFAGYECDKQLEKIDRKPNYSAQFNLVGPTKFEIVCSTSDQPYKSLELTLNLPDKSEVEKKKIQFKRPFSTDGCTNHGLWQSGLPAYPNEIDFRGIQNRLSKFKRGVLAGDNRVGFDAIYDNKERGHLSFIATIHSDARYCVKLGDALANPFAVGYHFRKASSSAGQLLDLISLDPEMPSRALIDDGLNKGFHQRRMRGKFLEE